ITSNWGVGHQVPLGLLMVGGALRDAGFEVQLLDAEALRLSCVQVAQEIGARGTAVVMTGHAGSTPAHPVCMEMLARIKKARPETVCVYGGVFPTYHGEQVLQQHAAVDIVVRGEGEATAGALLHALREGGLDDRSRLASVEGITFRSASGIVRTPERPAIRDLDNYPI